MQGIQAARAAYAERNRNSNNPNGRLGMDDTREGVAKVFGYQPYPPNKKANRPGQQQNDGNIDPTKVDQALRMIEEPASSNLTTAEKYGYELSEARAPSTEPLAPHTNVFFKSMEHRIAVLERENGTLRDVLVNQQKQMLERMTASESRIMSEVQRRVDLEMEVQTKHKSTDVASSVLEKRLAQMERLISSHQNGLGEQREMRKKMDEQGRVIATMQQRIDSAVQNLQSKAGGVREVDEDLSRVKTLLRQKEEMDKEFRETEKRKGAVLFGEVSRLGKIIEGSSERAGKGMNLLQQRIEGLEDRLKSDERGIMAMEGRDAEKFVAVARRAEELEKQLIELTDATLRQRAIVENEAAERRRLQSEQTSWMQEVRGALVHTDAEVSDKITSALSQLANRMLSERENMENRFKQLHEELTEQSRSREEATILEREKVKSRFKTIEDALNSEAESRVMELRKNVRDQDASLENTVSSIQRLETSQAEGFRRVDAAALRTVQETQSAITNFRRTVEEAQTQLEEVVRAEIKARMRQQEKVKTTMESGMSKLGAAIETTRNESAARLEGAMKALVSRADLVDEKIDNVQREMVTTLANQSRSQALINSEMLGRIDNVENREKADENEWESAVESINSRIDKYARANTDAIGALQSVVGDHRRQADESVSKLRADLTTDLKLMNGTVNTAMTQWSTDSHHETEMLRSEAARAFEDLRKGLFNASLDRKKATLAICDRLYDVQVKMECSAVLNTIGQTIAGSVAQDERREIRSELESEQVQGLLSDMMDSLTATAEREAQDARHLELGNRVEEATKRIDSRLATIDAAMTEETKNREIALADVVETNALEHTALAAKTEGIADGITSTAVNLEVTMCLADMIARVSEEGVLRKSDEVVAGVNGTVTALEAEMETLRASVAGQKEMHDEMQKHLDAVVGTFEQTKREEAAEWEKSMLQSEKMMDEMDNDEEMMGLGGGVEDSATDGTMDAPESGAPGLNVADAGFPDREGSEAVE